MLNVTCFVSLERCYEDSDMMGVHVKSHEYMRLLLFCGVGSCHIHFRLNRISESGLSMAAAHARVPQVFQ